MAINYRTRIVTTTPYSITNDDEVIFVNVSGPASIVLPSSGGSSSSERRSYYIKDYSGQSVVNPITITSLGAKTIDDASFAILNTPYSHIQVVYDGTNWKTI
jgi:hypothetical protein